MLFSRLSARRRRRRRGQEEIFWVVWRGWGKRTTNNCKKSCHKNNREKTSNVLPIGRIQLGNEEKWQGRDKVGKRIGSKVDCVRVQQRIEQGRDADVEVVGAVEILLGKILNPLYHVDRQIVGRARVLSNVGVGIEANHIPQGLQGLGLRCLVVWNRIEASASLRRLYQGCAVEEFELFEL